MDIKKSRKKLASGTRKNLSVLIDNLSYITKRKAVPTDNPREIMDLALDNTDSYIAALAMVIPEIDNEWQDSGAQEAFLKIKKRRKRRIRLLYSIAILANFLLIAVAVTSLIFIENWVKWIVFGGAVILIFLGSYNIPRYMITTYVYNFDEKIKDKFSIECESIDNFTAKLVKLVKSK